MGNIPEEPHWWDKKKEHFLTEVEKELYLKYL